MRVKAAHPQALVLAHPENNKNILDRADFIGSTGQMQKYTAASPAAEFIVASENGLLQRLRTDNPTKKFYPVTPLAVCPNMKKNTPEKLLAVLENEVNLVTVDAAVADRARQAIQKMLELSKEPPIIRHLVLPGRLDSTRELLRFFAERYAGRALLSVLFQYTPIRGETAPESRREAGPGRYITGGEYRRVLEWLAEFGIEEGFCQELAPGNDWLPDFERTNPFPSDLSVPVWHWRTGFLD
jgi:hypothetical protein